MSLVLVNQNSRYGMALLTIDLLPGMHSVLILAAGFCPGGPA
jgi:hypothetical protein